MEFFYGKNVMTLKNDYNKEVGIKVNNRFMHLHIVWRGDIADWNYGECLCVLYNVNFIRDIEVRPFFPSMGKVENVHYANIRFAESYCEL